MADEKKRRPSEAPEHGLEFPELPGDTPEFEQTPLTRGEYITALAHFYRAEMHRSLVWRTRLDTTTNWAIVSTLAILTTSLSNPAYATESLLLGMLANIVFVTIEARRFRFFDVWRGRVRMIEENFYGGILRRDQVSPQDLWGSHVADDLLCPRFHLTQIQAFRARLMRNFRYIFIFLLGAWLTNRFSPLTERAHTGINAFPEWVTDSLVGVIYLSLILIAVFTPKVIAPEVAYWGDPDHPGEMISSLDV
ncbi:MAG: putative membrane protein [Candidatus Krumholzibacteriia bacterium]|jgi:uncharacterized membrane protein